MAFKDEYGNKFSGANREQYLALLEGLENELAISPAQLQENAAFSLAMVARAALGLGAQDASILGLVSDCLAGRVALATMKHLSNAGANCLVLLLGEERSEDFNRLIQPLTYNEIPVEAISAADGALMKQHLQSFHACLLGSYDHQSGTDSCPGTFIDIFNEESLPIHCILCPPGINSDSGQKEGKALFSSSTLSLGIPFAGLSSASDYSGRSYCCDIALSPKLLAQHKLQLSNLFNEQPVVQIYPAGAE